MLTSVYAVHEDSVEKADLPVFIESLLEEWNAARKPGQFVCSLEIASRVANFDFADGGKLPARSRRDLWEGLIRCTEPEPAQIGLRRSSMTCIYRRKP